MTAAINSTAGQQPVQQQALAANAARVTAGNTGGVGAAASSINPAPATPGCCSKISSCIVNAITSIYTSIKSAVCGFFSWIGSCFGCCKAGEVVPPKPPQPSTIMALKEFFGFMKPEVQPADIRIAFFNKLSEADQAAVKGAMYAAFVAAGQTSTDPDWAGNEIRNQEAFGDRMYPAIKAVLEQRASLQAFFDMMKPGVGPAVIRNHFNTILNEADRNAVKGAMYAAFVAAGNTSTDPDWAGTLIKDDSFGVQMYPAVNAVLAQRAAPVGP